MTDTNIACKQLGYKSSVSYKYLGRGSGPIWLDLVKCNGDESSLDQCKHRGWGKHNCRHTEDVGVVCYAGPAPLRLQRKTFSPSLVHGVLQIYHNGQWGTICNRTWEMSHTSVACKQLGFKSAENFKYLGQGTGPIWLDNVKCNGGESSLHQCQHRGWGVHSCSHSQDVGIVCTTGTAPLRLLGKTSSPSLVQGILQIYHNGQWGTICNDTWGSNETNVACKVLGYERAVRSRHLGQGPDPIWLGGAVDCNSGESSLNQCQHLEWGKQYCTHSQDVGIVCYTGPPVQVRLIGDVPNAGRVQLLYKGVWKNLCDRYYYWNSNAAKVICRMAGYPDGYAVRMHQYKGSNDVWLSSYSCNGFEPYIELCLDLIWGKATCSDNNLAGVVCKSGSPNVSYRLIGSVPHAGRLEMRYYGSWMPVYSQNGLGLNDAHVICRMMGYNQAIIAFINIQERRSSYEVDMSCRGFENTTEQCGNSVSTSNNQRRETTWIVCKPHTESRFAVRFMDGMSLNEGRVEIGSSGVWGSLNERYRHRRRFRRWGLTAANIVCRMLGYRDASWTGRAKVLGSGLKTVFDHCTGNERSLEYCEYFPSRNYSDMRDIGVRCSSHQDTMTLQIRLEDGVTPHSGRVGIRYGNSWSTLCYEGLDYPDVKVICRMLGYVNVVDVYALRTPSSANGRVWLSGVECNGTEASILNCNRTGWWQTTCDFDAVITCNTLGKTTVDIRLENGTAPHSGRVGIRYGNTWGTLCNKGLDMNDSKVICLMLGYVEVSHMFTIPGNGTIWLSDLECNGAEDSIVDCSHSGWWKTINCTHDQDAAVTCNLADAPHFQIDTTNGITGSSAIINLAKATETFDARLKSSYQFLVKKGGEILSSITSDSNKTGKTCSVITKTVFKDSYITAEVPASTTSFTIGDGLYYHGYHNVPLEPGRVYRVHVRIVTMAMDGKKIFGKSSFARFATRPKRHSDTNSDGNDSLVIGLSVVLAMSISAMSALAGYIVYDFVKKRKKQKTKDINPQIEISDLTAARVNKGETSGQQYQEYLAQRSKKNAVSLAGNDSHYQSLVPQKRSKQSGGFGIESSYQVVGGPGKSTLSHTEEAIYENTNA